MPTITPDMVKSFVAHVVTGFGAASAMLLFVGISQGDVTALGAALQQIGDGVVKIVGGLAAIVPVLGGIYGAYKQSLSFRLKSLDADPEIERVKTVPGTPAAAVAASIPGSKVS